MNKSKLLDIFSRLDKEEMPVNLHLNSRVLIVDGMNSFMRSFSVMNRVNTEGDNIGGLIGFLYTLRSAVKLINPTRVVIVFDGEGGTVNRQYLYPQYKQNRTTKTILNYRSFSSYDEERTSMYNQIERLIDYLMCLPITNISIDKLEADDVIGFLCNHIYREYQDSEVYIVSTDNDFLQLVNHRVKVYNPIKKKIYNPRVVLDEYDVHPNNYLIYKTLIGDTSDNITGVPGFGPKNSVKLFPFLKNENVSTLENLYEHCETSKNNNKVVRRLLEIKNNVEIMYKIMDLKNPNISNNDVDFIKEIYNSKVPDFDRSNFLKIYADDKMGDAIPRIHTWIDSFTYLNGYN
jgi:DNA polymerase-1